MAVDIDSLQIEIEATSSDAAQKIDQLANSLSNLKSVAKGGAGLTAVTNQLNKLKNALSGVNGSVGALSSLSNTMKNIQGNATGTSSALGAVAKTARDAKIDYSSLSDEVKEAASQFAALPTKVQASANAISRAKMAMDGLSGSKASASLEDAKKSLDDLKKSATEANSVFGRLKSAINGNQSGAQAIGNAYAALPKQIRQAISANAAMEASNNKTARSFGVLGTGISSTAARFGVYYLAFKQIANVVSGWIKSANDYIENVNLFQVSMGEFYDEAFAYAQLVSDRMGIDPSEWMRSQGVFMSMANGFGLAREQAYALSEGLTELSYDLSSLYNEDVEQSVLRLQSALSGEIEPIRRLGISISQATLQEYALAHGIDESVASMTEQEKALLRSLVLMEGASRIGAIGDFAKTLESPANAMRILNQQIVQLGRALGTVLLPIIVQIIPWVQAFVSLLTDAIRALATLVGFTMPEWDASDWADGITGGATDAEDAIGGASDAAKELKKALLGIDELTILEPTSSGGAGGGGVGSSWASDLEIPDIWDKDAISQIQKQSDELKGKLEEILYDYVIPIGTAFAAWKIATGLLTGIEKLRTMLAGLKGASLVFNIGVKAIGLAGFLADLNEFMRYLEDFRKNGATFQNVAGMISEFVGMVGDALILLGNLKVGGALKVVQGIGEIIVAIKDISENGINWSNALTAVRGLTNIAIGVGLFTGNLKLAGASLAIQGFTVIIREIAENWDAIKQGDWSGVDKVTLVVGALEVLGGLAVALDAFSKIKAISSAGKAATTVETVATATEAVNTSVSGKLSPSLSSLAKNLGLGVAIIAEVSAAAVIIVGAIAILGYELEQVGIAWEPVIDNGATVAAGVGLGTAAIAAIGLATYGLGTLGATAAINIGIGTAILLELGIATGLFVVEIWAIGTGLDEIGQAWQPVLNNGETIASGIALGTSLLVGIGVATAALGAATVASVGLLPVAIGLGTAILVELAAAFVAFTESLIEVADELGDRLSPSLDDLNEKLPGLESDMADFTDYMTGLADEISSYTGSMGSITWDSIVGGFQKLFAGDPIADLADDVDGIYTDTITLNEKLELANPELEKAIELLTDYNSLMSELKLLTEAGGEIQLAKDMFVNLKEVGKQLVTGLSDGIKENSQLASNEMTNLGNNMIASLNNSLEANKYKVRNSLANLFTGVNIKLPHFSISGSFNLEAKKTPKINVSWYASGGFPDYGEMFIAREDGPELVGRIGNRTAVANNDQIVEGIASANDGVINAIYAMAQRIVTAIEENGGDIYVEADGTATQNRRNRMYGKTLQYI